MNKNNRLHSITIVMLLILFPLMQHAMESCVEMYDMATAALLQTPDSITWAQQQVIKTGEYEQFKALHHILQITQEVIQESKDKKFIACIMKPASFRPISRFTQTKQGFCLSCDNGPSTLVTPWGEINLYLLAKYNWIGDIAFTQLFFKRIKCLFEGVIPNFWRSAPIYRIDTDIDHVEFKRILGIPDALLSLLESQKYEKTIKKEITYEQEVQQSVGKEVFIHNPHSGYASMYNIVGIDDIILPTALRDAEEHRSEVVIDFIWNIMTDMYQKELNTQQ